LATRVEPIQRRIVRLRPSHSETRDYSGEAVGPASTGGAVVVHGIAVGGLQAETATTVWATCMVGRGHPVYSVALH
jgi:hypothetical protein